jgi:hypothetical protein
MRQQEAQYASSDWQSVETRETELVVDMKSSVEQPFDDTTSPTTDDTETVATTVDQEQDETLWVK